MSSGLAFGFDANLVINLDNVWRRNSQKWSFHPWLDLVFTITVLK